jgi:AAA ATPase domain
VPSLPSPFLRALEGLSENSGRTVVVAGPPVSGKSRLLEEFREQVANRGARVVQLRGSYRQRSVPFGALDGLRAPTGETALAGGGESDQGVPGPVEPATVVPVPYLSEELPRSRRARGSGRGRASYLGPVRARAANEGNPDAYWHELLPEFRASPPVPVVILIEDAALFDSDSREFIIALSRKARYRPFIIALALDTSNPGFVAWEEGFVGRGDVDWVTIREPLRDPREAHRLKAVYDDLPTLTQRVAGYVSLLGGNVGEVVLSRVARLSFPQLAEAMLPATGVGLLKVTEGKVSIPHLPWIPLTGDMIPETQRKEMHLEIANALAALSPEPNLARRIDVAHHYLEWQPGPMALRYLLEAAELSLQLLAYDSAEGLLAEALACTGAVPPSERLAVEAELRLLHAQSLFYAGRLTEAESELRDGLSGAFQAQVSTDQIAEWFEPLLLAIRAVGPRPSLAAVLMELAERAHDDRALEIEVFLESLLAEFHQLRREFDKSHAESHRAALIARKLPEGHMQAMALVAVALSRIEGTPAEQAQAARYLRAARVLLGKARRWELDYMAEDMEAHLHELRGNAAEGRLLRERSLGTVERQRLLPIELTHRLAIIDSLLDEGATKGVSDSVSRARSIAETLHLLPPSPLLLRLWLVEGRVAALDEVTDDARERWLTVADEKGPLGLPGPRAEALLRLALLEYARKQPEEAFVFATAVETPEMISALPDAWRTALPRVEAMAPKSEHGGARIPPPEAPLSAPRDPERRERPRR